MTRYFPVRIITLHLMPGVTCIPVKRSYVRQQYWDNLFTVHLDQLKLTLSLGHKLSIKSTTLLKSISSVICKGK